MVKVVNEFTAIQILNVYQVLITQLIYLETGQLK